MMIAKVQTLVAVGLGTSQTSRWSSSLDATSYPTFHHTPSLQELSHYPRDDRPYNAADYKHENF